MTQASRALWQWGSVPTEPFSRVAGITGKVVSVATGGRWVSVAVTTDGHAYVWGSSNTGQLGLGPDVSESMDAQRVPGLDTVLQAVVTDTVTLFLCRNSSPNAHIKTSVFVCGGAFGTRPSGPLGLLAPAETVTRSVAEDPAIVVLAAARNSIGIVMHDGTAFTGTLGNTLSVALTRVAISTPVRALACGGRHWIALAGQGAHSAIYTWGWGLYGQLGHDDRQDRPMPTVLEPLSGLAVSAVYASRWASYVRTAAGQVWATGWNKHGSLGTGDDRMRVTPALVDSVGTSGDAVVTQLAVSDSHAVAACADGRVFAWGDNRCGQVVPDAEAPVPASAAATAAATAATATVATSGVSEASDDACESLKRRKVQEQLGQEPAAILAPRLVRLPNDGTLMVAAADEYSLAVSID